MLTQPDSGWSWMILVASFSEHCIAGFCMYAIGLFHISILEQFHESVTLTSWLSSIFLCLLSSAGKSFSLFFGMKKIIQKSSGVGKINGPEESSQNRFRSPIIFVNYVMV